MSLSAFYKRSGDGVESTGFLIVYNIVNKCVFKLLLNCSYVGIFLRYSGRLFHKTAAAYENDLSPYDFVIVCGTCTNDFLLERSILCGLYDVNNSMRYNGAN